MLHIVKEIQTHRIRGWKTLAQFCAYGMLGMSVGIMGPTLLDLRQQVQTTLTNIALIMTARAGGHVIGSLTMGVIYSKINYQFMTSLLMFIAAIMTASIPFIGDIWYLLSIFAINGVVLGFCEAGSNVYLLELWGKETSGFMQIMHSMYGIGALIGPLICSPFLLVSEADDEDIIVVAINGTEVFHPDLIDLRAPYFIVASLLVFVSFFTGILYWFHPVTGPHPSRMMQQQPPMITRAQSILEEEFDQRMRTASGHGGSFVVSSIENDKKMQEASDNNNGTDTRSRPPVCLARSESTIQRMMFTVYKVLVVIFAMMFMHAFYGIEQGLGSFLMTFAVKSGLNLSKKEGAQVTTMFWASFSFSRFPKIFMINCMGNATNIFIGVAIMMSGCLILVPLANDHDVALWAGVALIGIGGSSIWACMYGYLDQYFPVTSLIGSMIFVSAVVGEFVFPVIISSQMESHPTILLWVVFGCTAGMAVTFILITLICRSKLRQS